MEWRSRKTGAGSIYKGRVCKVIPAVQAAFVDIGTGKRAFLHLKDAFPATEDKELSAGAFLAKDQELVVQVSKEPLGDKGARVTGAITLPGYLLVLLPTEDKVCVSRRIRDTAERERLESLAREVKPERMGIIVRTSALGAQRSDFERELSYLVKLWRDINEKARRVSPPALLYADLKPVQRALRDLAHPFTDEILIDCPEGFEDAVSFAKMFAPHLLPRITLYDGNASLFEHFGVEEEVEKALSNRVFLPEGGYLVIEETEALVSIDVNSGKFRKTKTLEETALRINLSAAKEIARQLRLRDIGGIIVIDFIGMKDPANRQAVLELLEEELSKDRAVTKVVGMSELGVVEMTRKRVRMSLSSSLTTTCPYCRGRGRVKTVEAVVFEVERRLLSFLRKEPCTRVRLLVSPAVARALLTGEKDIIEMVEKTFGVDVQVVPVDGYHLEKFAVLRGD